MQAYTSNENTVSRVNPHWPMWLPRLRERSVNFTLARQIFLRIQKVRVWKRDGYGLGSFIAGFEFRRQHNFPCSLYTISIMKAYYSLPFPTKHRWGHVIRDRRSRVPFSTRNLAILGNFSSVPTGKCRDCFLIRAVTDSLNVISDSLFANILPMDLL
jgi:hypothetical protein